MAPTSASRSWGPLEVGAPQNNPKLHRARGGLTPGFGFPASPSLNLRPTMTDQQKLPELPGEFGRWFREPRFFSDGFYRECIKIIVFLMFHRHGLCE